ncbi:AAA family ATPase [Meiothermus ruber]|jgi:exonuclease SbcC|uniref:SMC domain protein n=1 Tax=Meiothermus ruber (strain ATCC 35948 / DSM 1279 / VKM B-1258 / 21) TaxID=504728 RepID=D3PQL4_MEIRD|nr:SMC family ATPase [Meiothermus ruber]ADD27747.1 SMC domain protein [Meiothermus ruber DSM 1279]AGK04212.1 SMC domain-containing protein [Meiothermus ruber DSM 1279]MCL6530685.1 SMC family ATPase [Meiothermus ruber]
MKPLKLLLDGFGPYAEAQAVQFDHDVSLFAITGPTGSGKSTLLDAITYALYKATPRIGSSGLKDLKHPQAESAKVELTFAMGEQVWRVVRVVGKESQSRLEYLQQNQWKTHPASERVRELDAKLAEILGMDYETFTRAILLPQGQFDLFLRGSPKERRETLIKLYGLESLKAMRERAAARLAALNKQKDRLEGELDTLAEAEEERIAALQDEIAGLAQSERELGQRVEEIERTLKKLEELSQLYSTLEALRRRKQTWESEQPRIAETIAKLARAEQAERIWPQLEALQTSQRDLEQAQHILKAHRSELAKLEALLEKLRQGFDPERLEGLKRSQAQIPLLKDQEARLKRYGGQLELHHPSPLPFDEDRLEQLREAERLFADLARARTQAERAQTRLQAALREAEKAQAEHAELENKLKSLKDQGQGQKTELEEAKAALEREKLRQGIAHYHPHLKVGEPCPLCGHPVAALPPAQPQADLQALKTRVERLEATLTELRADYKAAQKRLDDLNEQLPKLQTQVQTLQAEADEAGKAYADLEAKSRALGSLEQVRAERTQRLAALAQEIRAVAGGLTPAAYEQQLLKELKAAQDRADQIAQAEASLTEARGKVQSQAEVVRVLEASLARQQEAVETLWREARFEDLEAVRAARLSPAEVAALRKRVQDHELEGAQIARELRELEAKLQGQEPVDAAQVAEQKQRLAELKEALDSTKQRLGARKEALKHLQKQLERKRQIQKEKADLDKQIDLWEQLELDLKGNRFQDFLLERYQSGLLSRASELIQSLSHNRYTLRLEDGDYFVFDRWTEALRPVRTLSGGESFMASLCLALSLSEHLSRGRIGALFLDEGFGTLDAETLEQVAGVLEALPSQGRLVGIVTHVEALAERMPARLEVSKSPAGSRVRWRD